MSGWGGNSGGGGGGGPPFWNNDCEATTSPADLNGTILAPPEGATYRQGERMDLSWQSGLRSEVLRIDGPPWAGGFHPASWQWSAFLESEDGSTNVTILGMHFDHDFSPPPLLLPALVWRDFPFLLDVVAYTRQ